MCNVSVGLEGRCHQITTKAATVIYCGLDAVHIIALMGGVIPAYYFFKGFVSGVYGLKFFRTPEPRLALGSHALVAVQPCVDEDHGVGGSVIEICRVFQDAEEFCVAGVFAHFVLYGIYPAGEIGAAHAASMNAIVDVYAVALQGGGNAVTEEPYIDIFGARGVVELVEFMPEIFLRAFEVGEIFGANAVFGKDSAAECQNFINDGCGLCAVADVVAVVYDLIACGEGFENGVVCGLQFFQFAVDSRNCPDFCIRGRGVYFFNQSVRVTHF